MEAFLIFILKSSGITALFLLFYVLLLKQETFFRANRIYLLTGLGISIILPFIVFTRTIWLQPMPTNPIDMTNFAIEPLSNGNSIDWLSLIFYGYIAGIFLFAMRFVLQLLSLHRLVSKSIKFDDGKFIRVETNQKSSPFSFLRYIVYNPNLHNPSELNTILAHEKVHAERRHSMDIIVMHIFTIFQWCNPFIWWYRACLDDNLEYLADTETIAVNTSKTEYQYLLLRTGMGEKHYSLVTPFFNTSIKKRINMLNQNRSERKNSFKYAFILPLLAGFTVLFNVKTVAQVKSEDSIQKDTNKYGPVVYDKERSGDFPIISISNLQSPFYIGDTVPLYIVDGREMSKTEFDKIDHNAFASISVSKGPKALEKYGDKAKYGAIEVSTKSPSAHQRDSEVQDTWKVGVKLNQSNPNWNVMEYYRQMEKMAPSESPLPDIHKALILINGVPSTRKDLESIKVNQIKMLFPISPSNKDAIKKYGNTAKYGVIEVVTKGV